MRIETVEYNVYTYGELEANAKEKVREWYLQGQEPYIFTDSCEEDLNILFGENELKVQYSLGYCQGDGFNIYGKINAKQIFDCLENDNGGNQLEKYKNILTDEEKEIILNYQSECDDIELPINNHYCYCIARYTDIAENWEYQLENYAEYNNINKEVLEKFESMVHGIFTTLCSDYETQGYKYFYEISEEDLEEMCEANEYEFLEDGTRFI